MAQLRAEKRVLLADLQGTTVRAMSGSMVAYQGQVEFKSAGMGGGGGFRAAIRQRVAGESISLMECSGHGRVHLAYQAQDVTVIHVQNDTVTVESEHILAVTPDLQLDVQFAGLRGMTSGQGLATTKVMGSGQLAIVSDGPLIGLEVAPGQPLVVDPDAYVAGLGNLQMSLVSGVTWRSLVGDGSGEPFSLRFEGHGRVYIQPAER
ncbi:AIM24 family protein [Nocardioides zeae]|uniref:AIM24 family protein n=1 Tax=Nocardioides imazamoxiresistens TaxID=3231893 RepID=A0ABU3PVE6_9ACTN|nr:AIM24 family protein [Nocardioides zeae]MDT9593216.1 AIM24 family protein [Nocardioides zeae]